MKACEEKQKNRPAFDRDYQETVSEYDRGDAKKAVQFWVILMILYYAMGVINRIYGVYLGLAVNGILALYCVLKGYRDKGGIASVGFGKKKAKQSVILGILAGLVIILINGGAAGFLSGRELAPLNILIPNFFYYMVVIALTEEIIFRGYLQTRIYGWISRPLCAVAVTGVMFMLMHIPFQAAVTGSSLFGYLQGNRFTLGMTFIWHVVFDALYRKYNSILAPTLFHGLMDWSNCLFI